MRAKFLIVGGGVMGTALAMRAARRTDPLTEPVVLLERRELGAGSSGRSGALLRQIYADLELASMARNSLREYAGFEGHTGRAIGFQRTGVLSIAGPGRPESLARLPRLVAGMQSIAIDVELLQTAALRERFPNMTFADGSLGAWEPGGGFVDPVRTVTEFAALARTYGAVTRLGTEAQQLVIEGGRVAGVETADGRILAERVVVVAGPWSRTFLGRSGIDLPLRTVRPEQHFHALPESELEASFDTALNFGSAGVPDASLERLQAELAGLGELDEPSAPHTSVIDFEHDFYTRCEPGRGRTRVGRTSYEGDEVLDDPDALDEAVSVPFQEWAAGVLRRRLPAYAKLDAVGAQAAWYTLTPDAQALIGPVPGVRGLIVATGFSGHGFKLAPSVAEGLTQMLFDEPVSAFDPRFFRPDRFAAGTNEWSGAFGF